ncbi:MAG: DUF58 domain-containing protein, partial [Candidatus Dadabacteria bacterium]
LGKDNWARTSPTREGVGFLVISLFVGFAAINTGNNLLYLTFGIMMSFVVASGILSMIDLSRIEVSMKQAGDVFAMTPAPLRITLVNKKSLLPSYSLSVEIDDKSAYVPHIPTGASRTVTLNHLFTGRGYNDPPEARVSTRFPFGFFKKWIKADLGEERILVYPKIENVDPGSEGVREKYGEREVEKSGIGDDLRSIKEFTEGDNPRLIHWKTTARTGRLMVKEMEDSESPGAVIEFNPETDERRLEHQISRLASLVVELLKRGFEVEFVAPDRTFSQAQIGRSPRPVLAYLALFGK